LLGHVSQGGDDSRSEHFFLEEHEQVQAAALTDHGEQWEFQFLDVFTDFPIIDADVLIDIDAAPLAGPVVQQWDDRQDVLADRALEVLAPVVERCRPIVGRVLELPLVWVVLSPDRWTGTLDMAPLIATKMAASCSSMGASCAPPPLVCGFSPILTSSLFA
jgi:hypothetical protein